MSAREDILGNIRRSLGVKGGETIRRQIVQDRLERAPKGVIQDAVTSCDPALGAASYMVRNL